MKAFIERAKQNNYKLEFVNKKCLNNNLKEDLSSKLNLYAITDSSWVTATNSLNSQVSKAIEYGVTMIQYREKKKSYVQKKKEARELLEICRQKNVLFIIDDDVLLAKEIDADGVHLGQKDMSPKKAREILGNHKIIGVTAKTVEQALEAQLNGADYLGVGAAFKTDTKKDTYIIEHSQIKKIASTVEIPVVAIGGINKNNGMNLIGTNVCGLAVVKEIFSAENIKEAVEELKNITKQLNRKTKTALTIAGSDSSGGAGIQADLKTFNANKVYGMSAITAITAQNTKGVFKIENVSKELLDSQLESIFTDIYPDAIKIGMIAREDLVKVTYEKLTKYEAKNIVIDPVMVATSGANLTDNKTIKSAQNLLYPLATVLTPNIPEAEILSNLKIKNEKDMEKAAKIITQKYKCATLIKGGHCINSANDFLYEKNGNSNWIKGRKINNSNTHGTGCTLSSAIASNLAKGCELKEAIILAKKYIEKAIGANLDLGLGSGPMAHFVSE
ncbi:bifunctional hydroxymethylpyrimidine kinase/phosphomethylpyrimidine kinase [Lachnobacterium bovis]|uniref:Thiamine-phosphate synthase n=1 Tax=Lachnobacterium bovis TaxID=140626 RepID=A0A1H9R2F5_9FIRM|nr:bifunctional hydroxymethylpyrimidine kinase/phosphomethylpyrimidine kinase [Lachnobacterium bovis]SER66916.1 hydroxymethylpyrimidine kinase / phosphomethylpyrimidine kinase / thiamine-phosphate diphosphorylase [Lachnobacterium bovis]